MTFPSVDELPDGAAYELLTMFAAMSGSKHAGVARWAAGVFGALVARLTGVEVIDAAPEPLSVLSTAELGALTELCANPKQAFCDDPDAARWYREMYRMLAAEPGRRELQHARDRAVLQTLEADWTPPPVPAARTAALPPWSQVSRPADDDG
ncbi:hypothetical protein [Mycobacterium persicum]|uniref:hypothetical protein n=1 Tax=Mycobacterium persicum TaxID=1487726 RepID=UPI0013C338B6|nr:hypothetical protein [Mycobacterium persicum]